MKNAYRLVILSILLLVSVAFSAASAQTSNLLTNPGFEPPFNPVGDDIFSDIAEGWTLWYVPAAEGMSASDNMMPEYFAASDTVNGLSLTPRIHGGADAQQYFSYYGTHTGGLYQQANGVSLGANLSFSVWAYLWASDAGETSDGSGAITFQVGIDPTGGTNGESEDIVWSEPLSVYDEWHQYSVTATALAESVTAFIRSTATAKIANNVIYVDDAELTLATGEETPVPAETDAVEPEPTVTVIVPTAEVATDEPATEEAATEVPTSEATEAVVTEVPTEAPTTVPPTEVPTEVPTETATAVPPTEIPTEAPSATPLPSPTLDTKLYPTSVEHIVQSGDTVQVLAQFYGTSVDAIIIANGLNEDAFISVGQTLIIPLPLPLDVPTAEVVTEEAPTEAAPTSAPTATEMPAATATQGVVPSTPLPPAPSQPVTYVIQFGDTLSGIAYRFGTTSRELARLNGITNPNLIYYGQLLIISLGTTPTPTAPTEATPAPTNVTAVPTVPAPVQTYRVQPGDSLYSISLRFGVPVYQLVQANNLANPNFVYVGQVLIIP